MSLRSHRGRRPSLGSPMSWLTRSSSTSSHILPIRASHSKSSSVGTIRHGNLGASVTIVRTPQEALAGTGVSVGSHSDLEGEDYEEEGEIQSEPADQTDSHAEQSETPSVPPAYSPPRSSLPLSKSTPSLPLKDPHSTRPARSPPLTPKSITQSTQKKLPPPPLSSFFPAVPPLLSNLPNPSSPLPFDCILLSPAPPSAIDFSKLLVTVETCTATHRTTFGTLTSRPSRLSSYLKSLFSDVDEELEDREADSLSSQAENGSFNSIFHNHLASSGLLSPSAFNVHIFLDRASPSYDHILAYLRSPPSTADHVASLPHAVQLHAATPARFEALLVLRDEAAYLGLSELVDLCTAELRRNPNINVSQLMRSPSHVLSHTRGPSNGSIRSMGTLRERDEEDAGADADVGSTSTSRDSIGSAKSTGSARGRGRSRSAASASTTPGATVPAGAEVTVVPPPKDNKEPSSQQPTPSPLLHRRLASQSRERAELIEVKSATLRGRSGSNWL
ncbi:hypothetical protein DFH94DRAFT_679368 [Russula ochroleuca]|uniref:BTB/POZ domain-containing protein n=1 Tax=Russula ochroleuca TaxID=152965 RepID=A0A9P5N291_9AGAM|nr:hypothetical protein DFH94DRAFT_679368 [Russula ochroleuca]